MNRQPRGVPLGGAFAENNHDEAVSRLAREPEIPEELANVEGMVVGDSCVRDDVRWFHPSVGDATYVYDHSGIVAKCDDRGWHTRRDGKYLPVHDLNEAIAIVDHGSNVTMSRMPNRDGTLTVRSRTGYEVTSVPPDTDLETYLAERVTFDHEVASTAQKLSKNHGIALLNVRNLAENGWLSRGGAVNAIAELRNRILDVGDYDSPDAEPLEATLRENFGLTESTRHG